MTSTVTTSAEQPALVVVDTNVLLAATDRSRHHHHVATTFLRLDERRLAVTPQILREYLAVATRPVVANGLGMPASEAVANIEEILAAASLLGEGPATLKRLLHLLATVTSTGKQIHDANIVACAFAHGATAIVTADVSHFTRYASMISVEDLGSFDA